ncbi:MAG TPA: hypothetical protein VFQ85_15775 [Mycobacteriales bacterium]|nr:hypothetical protein [Mycobacteriales bacterium]
MTTYSVRIALHIVCDDPAETDSFTDALMDELVKINQGADLGGSLTTGTFDVWVTEEAASPTEAVVLASGTVRAAAHAAGGDTRDWPDAAVWPEWLQEKAVEARELGLVGA